MLFLLFTACNHVKSDTAAPGDTGSPDTDTEDTDTEDTDTADTDTEDTDTTTGAGPTVARVSDVAGVVDAAPLPDGATFVFVASDGSICNVPADGAKVAACRTDLFTAGLSLVPSLDGESIFVAGTPAAAAAAGEEPPFVVAAVAIGVAVVATGAALASSRGVAPMGDAATILAGTESYGVRAVNVDGSDVIFTGYAPDTTRMGVFRIPTAGGTAETVVAGFAADLSGVVVAADGTVYAAGLASDGTGALFEIVDGVATAIATGFEPGEPAGVALTPDDATVMVSAVSDAGTSEVVLVDRATHAISIFDDVIRENTASGGLHQASDSPGTYAWCGVTAGVYAVRL